MSTTVRRDYATKPPRRDLPMATRRVTESRTRQTHPPQIARAWFQQVLNRLWGQRA